MASSKEGNEIRGKISLVRLEACVCKSFPAPHGNERGKKYFEQSVGIGGKLEKGI